MTCEIDLCNWSTSGTPSPSLILSVLGHLGESNVARLALQTAQETV